MKVALCPSIYTRFSHGRGHTGEAKTSWVFKFFRCFQWLASCGSYWIQLRSSFSATWRTMNSNNGSTPGAIEFVEPPGTGGDKDQSPTTAPHLVLYCFPHAGGSPSSFRHWPGHPDFPRRGKIQVRVLSLPGRGGRFSESPWENWNSYDAVSYTHLRAHET